MAGGLYGTVGCSYAVSMAQQWLLRLVALIVTCGPWLGCSKAPQPKSQDEATGIDTVELDYGSCGSKPTLVVQDGTSGLITVVALSADGRILATTGSGNSIALWNTYSGLLLRRVPTDGPPEALAVSNDGERVAYGWTDKGNFVRAVHVSGDRPPQEFDHALGFALSPDGRWLALATKGGVELVETATGSSSNLDVGPAAKLAFDPKGRLLAVAGVPLVQVVALDSREVVERFEPGFSGPGTYQQHAVPPNRLHFGERVLAMESAGSVAVGLIGTDGKVTKLPAQGVQQAAAGGARVVWPDRSGRLQVFDARTGETTALPADPDLVGTYRLAMSGDGSRLAIASAIEGRPTVRLRDGRTLAPIRSMAGQTAGVVDLAASGDGRLLLTSSQYGSQVAAWNLETGELRELVPTAEFNPMAARVRKGTTLPFAPVAADRSDRRVAIAGPTGVTLFDGQLEKRHELRAMLGQPLMLAFSGDHGLVAVSAHAGIFRWDLRKPAAPPTQLAAGLRAARAAVSPDGTTVATISGTSVTLVRTSDGSEVWSERLNLVVTGDARVAFAADGSQVVAMFDARDPGPPGDGRGRVFLFDAETGEQRSTIEPGTAGPLAIRGNRLAIGGYAPAIVDLGSRQVLHRVAAPDQNITAVEPHPTLEGVVLMAGDGGSTSLVSVESGEVLAILRATTNGEYVTATPAGLYRASVDGARSIAWSFGCPLEAFPFAQFAASYERPELIERALAGEQVTPPQPLTRPPFVRLAAAPSPETEKPSLRLPIEVASRRHVERVRIFVNGHPAAERSVGRARAALSVTVPLDPGRNRITAIAYDDAGLSSNPALADVICTATEIERPDLWIVAVGVSRYPKLAQDQQLEVADDDARAIAGAFQRQAGPAKPFARAYVTTLLDQRVTVQSLTAALEQLSEMKPRDLAVVFLAGHGVRLADVGSVFLTSGASLGAASAKRNGVGWDRLSEALGKARGRVLVLLDACHSGHLSTENVVPNDALARQLSAGDRTGVLVYAAARGHQLSYEVSSTAGSSRALELAYTGGAPRPAEPMPPQATGHGLFTAAVLEALGGRAVDIDHSEAIELGEFVAYTTERVRVMSGGQQTPWIVREEMFGDFPLAPASP